MNDTMTRRLERMAAAGDECARLQLERARVRDSQLPLGLEIDDEVEAGERRSEGWDHGRVVGITSDGLIDVMWAGAFACVAVPAEDLSPWDGDEYYWSDCYDEAYTCPRCEQERDHGLTDEAACVACGVCAICVPTCDEGGEYCAECSGEAE